MKQYFLSVFAVLLFAGCRQEIQPKDISHINGYWEIEKVVLPDGKSKDYKINETIDYFQIENNAGFRKKVMPQIDGKYLENGHAEQIKVIRANDKTYLNYNTECCTWKEEIINVSDKELVLKNEAKIEYHYKKPTPFSEK